MRQTALPAMPLGVDSVFVCKIEYDEFRPPPRPAPPRRQRGPVGVWLVLRGCALCGPSYCAYHWTRTSSEIATTKKPRHWGT